MVHVQINMDIDLITGKMQTQLNFKKNIQLEPEDSDADDYSVSSYETDHDQSEDTDFEEDSDTDPISNVETKKDLLQFTINELEEYTLTNKVKVPNGIITKKMYTDIIWKYLKSFDWEYY